MELILIRHGRPERSEGTSDPHLSSLGHEQAARVARWLEVEPFDAVWSSTMRRAVQTAEPFATQAGHTIRQHAGIVEDLPHLREVLAVGLPAAWVAARALHGLSRRWVVLVPAGLVLHDHHALVEPVLVPRAMVRRLGPASLDDADDALDLTQRAFGLALVLELDEPVVVSPRRPDKIVQVASVDRLLFTPTRPGALLGEAGRRRIPVG